MISIIGAGPAGSYLAYLLAKAGKEVTIFEEHKDVGSPVQCTGIVTHSISQFFSLTNDVIANTMDTVKIISKNNEITAKTREIVMWRNKFDLFAADLAKKAGAKIETGHQFVGFSGKNTIKVKNKENNEIKEIKSEYIVGADGPSSAVAKEAGIDVKSKFWIGMQAKVKLKSDTTVFETYFGDDFPNFFGWVVPESEDVVRLGLGAFENANEYFYRFLKKRTGKKDIMCWESGIFPVYDPKKIIQKGNVYLIGDAATQVKATTGGGIIPSLKAAKTLSECILHNKNYTFNYKIGSGKELRLHLLIRNILNKFKDADYDHLLELMKQEKVQKVLKKYDRDTPIPLVMNLLLREPRFLKYAKFVV